MHELIVDDQGGKILADMYAAVWPVAETFRW